MLLKIDSKSSKGLKGKLKFEWEIEESIFLNEDRPISRRNFDRAYRRKCLLKNFGNCKKIKIENQKGFLLGFVNPVTNKNISKQGKKSRKGLLKRPALKPQHPRQ